MESTTTLATIERIESKIYTIRRVRVVLDSDLAALYGVEARVLNQAVNRNKDRFPGDFVLHLSARETKELQGLRSQSVILKRGQHLKFRPLAFTEHGALMAATILNSPHAGVMSIYIIRAFVRMREDLAANAAILKRQAEIDKTLLLHDGALRDIYQKLRPLLEPPPPPPKPEIGFHVKEDAVPYRVKRQPARVPRNAS